jgi:multiple sugar transport system permease protein
MDGGVKMPTLKMPTMKRKHKEVILGYAFASPWLIGFFAFTIIPLLTSIYYSLTNYNTLNQPDFVGLSNYSFLLFNDPIFWRALGNTLFHVALATPFSLVLGILVALVLNAPVKGLGIWRTIFYLPNVVSAVAMALLWVWLFNKDYGLINEFLGLFGIESVNWLGDPNIVKISLILMGAWGSGITALFFLGAIKGIPKELYEVAAIAGTSKTSQFFKITLPMITSTILFMLITTIIGAFQMFTLAYIMTSGGPDRASYYLGYYLFDKGIMEKQMGYASAISWIMFSLVLLIIFVIFKTSKKWVFYLGSNS